MSAEACLGEQGPDPKVLISYLAFLCARLLEVSKEERAAFRLQQIWKRRRTILPGQSNVLCKKRLFMSQQVP